jgi:GTP pyrophosphokinase
MALTNPLLRDHARVAEAHAFAKHAHRGQVRKNGEPYINHVTDVAEIVAELNLGEDAVIAALLHDILEQTPYTLDDIAARFGADPAHLITGIERLGTIKYRGNAAQRQVVYSSILGGIDDARILMIKLADRLDNMKTIHALPPETQKRIALETAEIYAPLAAQLGMHRISGDLAEMAFPVLYPDEHRTLVATVTDHYRHRTAYLKRITPILEAVLAQNRITPQFIDYRAKRYHSLYEKLKKADEDISNVYDLIAIRIIVATIEECYAALGIIHSLWPPAPGRIKDYIALPKENGYRSLHTTVFSPSNKLTEIQIRTSEMHTEAEHGVASHFLYKNRGARFTKRFNQELIKRLREWRENPRNTTSFKIDFFRDRIFVNTPKGEIIDLPSGATPVDFAYQIHTEVGNTCRGALVNGRVVPLHFALKSGDSVEILTQKHKKPSTSWLEFVQTNTARYHIRAVLRSRRDL